ncbi:hypothetical protein pkur_cds_613 [Pandoravirus kuranda]|uniref:Ankyrin repeat domain containing protein n=1 Tax=Pandoravirus kuranda TaxID=3019033 RepID=A0AA95J3S6_9VIRU|nr:hypothetical protein pkur_cds_613 [Pandoravirus kuranda]
MMSALEKQDAAGRDEATSGDAATPRGTGGLVDDRPTGLGDLPPEVRAQIVGMLVSPRHIAAARMASRLFAVSDDMDTVMLRRTSLLGVSSILLSRAPLPLIAKALQAFGPIRDPFILVTAASLGRLDVLRLVHAAIEANPAAGKVMTSHHLVVAVESALRQGHVDVARYIMSRSIAGVRYGAVSGARLCVPAAAGGHATSMAFAHDHLAKGSGDAPCVCTSDIGRLAWEAPLPDAALWLKEHGCTGYTAPTSDDLDRAIACGCDDTLRAILTEIDVCHRQPSRTVDRALCAACCDGNLSTVMIAARAGLVVRAMPLYVGASACGHTHILDYAESLFGTPRDVLRAAAIAAAGSTEGADSMRWISAKRPDVIDVTIMWMAIKSASLDTVRIIDGVLGATFDWQRAAHAVLDRGEIRVLEFAVKEKGTVVDVMAVEDGVTLTPCLAQWLVSHYGLDAMQPVFDAVSTAAARNKKKVSFLNSLESVKGACVRERSLTKALADVYHFRWDDSGGADDPTGGRDPCGCRRCRRQPESPRPIKRPRTDPTTEGAAASGATQSPTAH